MTEPAPDRDPIEQLAESFVRRFRRGERPSIDEYVDRHPKLAREIEELFPTLVMMEQVAADESGRGRAPEQSTPAQLGDYRIIREVGRGGMGIVYEAVQESLDRRVALKVLPSCAMTDPSAVARFRLEAHAAARLHHTNVVPVFGVGHQDGICYYAMQFIDGHGLDDVLFELRRLRDDSDETPSDVSQHCPLADEPAPITDCGRLAERLRAGKAVAQNVQEARQRGDSAHGAATVARSVDESTSNERRRQRYYYDVARIGLQAAEALAHAHAQGVIHRDVKPSNLLLDYTGTVWVADFGLAKDEADDQLTHTGDLVGTLRFMAPERFHGECDARSDIYGLGLTLYELATLTPAFDTSDRQRLLREIVRGEPPRPQKLDARIPRDLETIILKSIAKEPERRYASCNELADDLRRFLADRPVAARRASVPEHIWRWCRRNPLAAMLMTAIAVVLLAGIGISSYFAVRSAGHARDATEKLWAAYLAEARARRLSGRVGQRFESLKAIRAATAIRPAPELRDEAIACLALVDLQLESSRPLASSDRVAFGPHLDRYAETNGSTVTVRRSGDGKVLFHHLGPGHWQGAPRFSADGRLLAQIFRTDTGAECQVWEIDSGKLKLNVPTAATAEIAAFCPDRRSIAVIAPGRRIERYDLESGELLEAAFAPGHPIRIAPHRDGRTFAVLDAHPEGGDTSATVFVIDLPSGRVLQSIPQPKGAYTASWHPDGKHLAILCMDWTVQVWDAEAGQLCSVLRGHQSEVVGLVFQPGHNLLATTSWDGTVRIWNPLRGNQLLWAFEAFPIRFTADGTRFSSCRPGIARTWKVAKPACRTLHEFSDAYKGPWHANFSADGQLLVSAGDDGVRLWHVPTGREIEILPVGPCRTAVFGSSGHSLIASGVSGVWRWPIAFDHEAHKLQIGQRETILGGGNTSLPRLSVQGDYFVRVMDPDSASVGRFSQPRRFVSLRHPAVAYVALSPDSRWVATGTWGGKGVRVWNALDGTLVKELVPDSRRTQVGFSPDGRWLVAGTEREYRLWRVGSWELGWRWAREPTDLPGPFAFTGDGRMLAIAQTRYVVQLADTVTGKKLAKLETPDPVHLCWLAFSPDGSQLAAASESHAIQLWDLRSIRRELRTMKLDWDLPPYPPPAPANSSYVPSVEMVPLTSGGMITHRSTLATHAADVRSVAVSPNGKILATGSFDRTVKLWDAKTLDELGTLGGHNERVNSVAFAPDGKKLVAVDLGGGLYFWDVTARVPLATLQGHPQGILSVSYSPDGNTIVTTSVDGTAKLWDAATTSLRADLTGHQAGVECAAFAPSGRVLATGSWDGQVKLWDPATARLLTTINIGQGAVRSLAFAPDGRILATCSADESTVRLWNTESWKPRGTIGRHAKYIQNVIFSPDGRMVATGGWDGVVALWNAETGRRLDAVQGHDGGIWEMAFSLDGKQLVTAGADGMAKVWDVATVADKSAP